MPINSFENYPMSWKPDKSKLKQPLYLSLAKLLEDNIKNGALAPHTKLPPQRELADYLDINLSTITKAFKQCQLNGFLYAVIGRGTFVAPNAGVSISIQDTKMQMNTIEMGIIKPFDLLNQYTEEALKKVLAQGSVDTLLNYSTPFGSPYQKSAALKWLHELGLHAHAEDIFFTTGGQNAFAILLITLFRHGDKIATDHFTYSNFIELANMLNIKLIPIQSDDVGMLPEDLEMQCRLQGIQGVYLAPTYSNPTGTLMDTPRKEALAKIIKLHHLILLEDDIYAFLAPETYVPISALCPQHGCYISSLSKAICSGLRVAMLYVPHRFTSLIARGIFNINIKTSSLNVETAAYMIHTGIATEVMEKKKNAAYKRNLIFEQYFPSDLPTPYAFCRCVTLPAGLKDLPMEQLALEQGLHLFHSNRFLVGTPGKEQFLRIALTSADTKDDLEYGLKKLKHLLSEDERKLNEFTFVI